MRSGRKETKLAGRASKRGASARQQSPVAASLALTERGDPLVRFIARGGAGVSEREVSAAIHEFAAALERRSQNMGADWVVSPTAYNRRLVVELIRDSDLQSASQVVLDLIKDRGLL